MDDSLSSFTAAMDAAGLRPRDLAALVEALTGSPCRISTISSYRTGARGASRPNRFAFALLALWATLSAEERNRVMAGLAALESARQHEMGGE